MTPAARLLSAIELLADVESNPRKPADAVANDFFRARRYIGAGDRRTVSDRAWAVMRARRRLGWWVTRGGLEETPRVLVAASLLLSGWTLDGVRQSYSGGQYAPTALGGAELAGLRALEGHTFDHPDMPAAVRLDVPDWLLPHLAARFGATLDAELAAMGQNAPLDLRVNLLKSDLAQARIALLEEGLEAEPTPYSPWGLRLAGRRPVTSGQAFKTGLIEIQDEGSQLIAALVGAKPEMRVADWCAGAGGKTLALAMTMENRGHIVASDVSAVRLESAVRRLRRAGVYNVERHLSEAGDKWVKRRAASFDRVLVDAPCTGTGTWRRNPDARLRLEETDLAELLPKQAAILQDAAKLVRPGGWLIYATCSVLHEENEAQVAAFLAAQPDFALLPLAEAWGLPGQPPCTGAYLALTPGRHGTDGFFAAVLARRAKAVSQAGVAAA